MSQQAMNPFLLSKEEKLKWASHLRVNDFTCEQFREYMFGLSMAAAYYECSIREVWGKIRAVPSENKKQFATMWAITEDTFAALQSPSTQLKVQNFHQLIDMLSGELPPNDFEYSDLNRLAFAGWKAAVNFA